MKRTVVMVALTMGMAGAAPSRLPSSSVAVTGGEHTYAALLTGSSWQTLNLPRELSQRFDLKSLTLSAPGLTLKVKGSSTTLEALRLSVDVQRTAAFQAGSTAFTLSDAAGHSATFDLDVY